MPLYLSFLIVTVGMRVPSRTVRRTPRALQRAGRCLALCKHSVTGTVLSTWVSVRVTTGRLDVQCPEGEAASVVGVHRASSVWAGLGR